MAAIPCVAQQFSFSRHTCQHRFGILSANLRAGTNVIKSALAQRYEPLDIVVSDNCSTDDTAEVVRSFDDPRLRCVRPAKNLGSNGNYNNCLEQRGTIYWYCTTTI